MAKKATGPKEDHTAGGDKKKALDMALQAIEKQFGKGSVMLLGDDLGQNDLEFISTGIPELDLALAKKVPGGIPKGRIIEIYGPESSGKTTLTLHIAKECQLAGGTVAFVDAEHALDTAYAERLGVDVGSLILSQPDCGEQALEITDKLVQSGAVDLIIVDSVAALTPKAELEGDMGDSHMGLQARMMSQGLRKLTGGISRTGTTVIFINQLRMKIGVMFGNPETTTGGNALKFYASVRMDIRGQKTITVNEEVVGRGSKVKIVKNKVAPPFKEVELDMFYERAGFDADGSLLNLAVKFGVVEASGAWFKFKGASFAQGRPKAIDHIRNNPVFKAELEDLLANVFSPESPGEIPLAEAG
jgi:recombination protein RecA